MAAYRSGAPSVGSVNKYNGGYVRGLPGWRRKEENVYESEDGRFRALKDTKGGWLLVTDRETNERAIADTLRDVLNVCRVMEAATQ